MPIPRLGDGKLILQRYLDGCVEGGGCSGAEEEEGSEACKRTEHSGD